MSLGPKTNLHYVPHKAKGMGLISLIVSKCKACDKPDATDARRGIFVHRMHVLGHPVCSFQ